jgi:carbon-monoxide dehydrogenase medium subunit
MDLPMLGVAIIILPEINGNICHEARIAISLACPVPIRAYKAESYVAKEPLSWNIWSEAGVLAESESNCRTSFRTTAEFRRDLIRNLIPRAAEIALGRHNLKLQKG